MHDEFFICTTVTRTGSGRSAVGSASIESGHVSLYPSNFQQTVEDSQVEFQVATAINFLACWMVQRSFHYLLHSPLRRVAPLDGFAFHPHGKAWASGHAAPRRGPGLGLSESTRAQWMMISKGLVQKKGDIYIYIHFVY